ncbi:hypothetical protein N7534_000195 [Penicillium rubens]|nr:hypothetical protein N7534_000195 [Penicillium rubens]
MSYAERVVDLDATGHTSVERSPRQSFSEEHSKFGHGPICRRNHLVYCTAGGMILAYSEGWKRFT